MTSVMPIDGSDLFDRLETLIKSQSGDTQTINQIIADLGASVVSLGVLNDGHISTKVFGGGSSSSTGDSSSKQTSSAYDKDTLFQACSISKPISALAVIKLCQEGILDLDAPISQYLSPEQLSWMSTPKTQHLVSEITLRNLLSHTSGLSCHGFDGYADHKGDIPSLEQTLRGEAPANNEPVKLSTFPGQKYEYSGGGYQVIQLILETQLKKPFPKIMKELILDPLGMDSSTYEFIGSEELNYAPVYLTGRQKAYVEYHLMPESAAAGLWTTPEDLLKVIHAVQCSLSSGDILERKWAEIMVTEIEDNEMALGWMKKKDTVVFAHWGYNSPGYISYFAGFLGAGTPASTDEIVGGGTEEGKDVKLCGVAIMTNSALGVPLMKKIVQAVSYLMGWPSLYQKFDLGFGDRSRVVDGRAREWCGRWRKEKGVREWVIDEGDEGGLILCCGELPAVELITAAVQPKMCKEGRTINLVADGLEIMLRLMWKDGKKVVELWLKGGVGGFLERVQ
ncbi:hypothetical protein VTL71DRAFT_16008 [Oculimacula yallundae]|uniref:Beta-lactamase-related domain-containing protein n=1 Tax=Oculimacula yallundae TaxID=86028 RepID=A0ABR4CD87_9HELO